MDGYTVLLLKFFDADVNYNRFNYMQKIGYRYLSEYYNNLTGKGLKDIYNNLVNKYLHANKIKQGKILEIACGTGKIIESFAGKHKTYGLDISPWMIKEARKKNGKSKYFVADMTNFKLPEKFDAIICPFDSINHLQIFSDWKKVFASVIHHLKEGGIFIFDFNTLKKFINIDGRVKLENVQGGYIVMETQREKNFCNWNILIFKKENQNIFRLFRERVRESTFPLGRVTNSLKKEFTIMKIVNLKKERIFIVCQKKPDKKMSGMVLKKDEGNF